MEKLEVRGSFRDYQTESSETVRNVIDPSILSLNMPYQQREEIDSGNYLVEMAGQLNTMSVEGIVTADGGDLLDQIS